MKIAAQPGLRIPDLTIDWYIVCGKVETAMIRNIVVVGARRDT